MGPIWGFRTLTKKVSCNSFQILPVYLLGECWKFFPCSALWPNFGRLLSVRHFKLTKHSSERLMFVTGSRAVEGDYAIGDALFQQKHKLQRIQWELVTASFWPVMDFYHPIMLYYQWELFAWLYQCSRSKLSEIWIQNYFKEMLT